MNLEEKQEWHHVFHSMGIPVHLTLLGVSQKVAQEAAAEAEKVFHLWDDRASRFKETSELMKVIRSAGEWMQVSQPLFILFQKALALSKKTKGLFDISVGAYLAAAGYGLPKNYQLPQVVPRYTSIELDEKTNRVKIAPGQVVEPAALVKGTAIDEAAEVLRKNIPAWMINAGGDVLTHGLFHEKKWRIGIQDPRDTQKIIGVVEISNAALATSGTYVVNKNIQGEHWHHEINPKTGKPTSGILSLSVIAASAYQADVVSTVAFLHDTEAESYLRKRTEPFLIVTNDVQIVSGNGWQTYSRS